MHLVPQVMVIPPRPSPLDVAIHKQQTVLKNRSSPAVPAANWKVSKNSLMCIPPYYRLECTHVYISNATPEEVAQRIAVSIRTESIAATFDNKQSMVTAETNERVKFGL
jgi:hypothetical protein